jgi:putative membrane protein
VTEPRRTHPVTPLVTMVRAVVPIAVFMFVMEGREASQRLGVGGSGLVLFALVAGVGGFAWISWARLTYFFDDDGDLRIHSGVITRNERRVQVSRIQSVDITQPLIARLFGLAELRPEVAGAANESTKLKYLSMTDADQLREELLDRAAGERSSSGAAVAASTERVLYQVPPLQLLAAVALQPLTIGLVALVPVVGFVAVVAGAWGLGFGGLLLLATPFFIVGGQFVNHFGFSVAESSVGLRLRFGLTSHRSQTVPAGRVQAVRVERPLLWRPWGWVRVVVNVAGSTGGDDADERPSVLLPVAPEAIALTVLQRVLPDVDLSRVVLEPAPPRARWRAPLQWRLLGVGASDRVLVTRRGWLVPKWDVVPHARTQSVRLTQGPWQRRLGLASMHIDSTPGPVRVIAMHRSEAEVRGLVDAQADRARLARGLAGPGQSESASVPMGSGTPLVWSSHQNPPRDAGSASSTAAEDAES